MQLSKTLMIFILLLILGGIFTYEVIMFYNLDAPLPENGERNAAMIISSLENYQRENGAYPADLSQLVPKYLQRLPKPDLRHDYCYTVRDDHKAYTIAFIPRGEAIGDGFQVYRSWTAAWRSGDSDFYGVCDYGFRGS